jgi:hypothetical protein
VFQMIFLSEQSQCLFVFFDCDLTAKKNVIRVARRVKGLPKSLLALGACDSVRCCFLFSPSLYPAVKFNWRPDQMAISIHLGLDKRV